MKEFNQKLIERGVDVEMVNYFNHINNEFHNINTSFKLMSQKHFFDTNN